MINTTLCYIEKDDSYLMLHRVKKENDMNRDKWLGIGGKFEPGETPHECMHREILEETGLIAEDMYYRGIVTFVSEKYGSEYMHLFTVKKWRGDIINDCNEGVLKWVKKRDIDSLPIWEGDKIFLRLLETENRFFSLKLNYDKNDNLVSHTIEF